MSFKMSFVKHEIVKFRLRRSICNFSNFDINQRLESEELVLCNDSRKINFFIGRKGAFVEFFLHMKGNPEDKPVHFEVATAAYIDDKLIKCSTFYKKMECGVIWGFAKFLDSEQVIKDDFIENGDEIRIECSGSFSTDTISEKVFKNLVMITDKNQRQPVLASELEKEDVTIIVGAQEIKARRNVLEKNSKYFQTMLENVGMIESKTGIIKVTDFEYAVIKEMIEWIYSGRVPAEEHAVDCLRAADKYELLDLKKECQAICFELVNKKNIFEMLQIAESCNAKELKAAIFDLIIENKEVLFKTPNDIVHQLSHELTAQIWFYNMNG